MTALRQLGRFVARVARCGRTLATDRTIPTWVRGLLVFGCLPIPLFLDEAALCVAVGLLAVAYRPLLISAWKETAR